jgi:hypothetical protein
MWGGSRCLGAAFVFLASISWQSLGQFIAMRVGRESAGECEAYQRLGVKVVTVADRRAFEVERSVETRGRICGVTSPAAECAGDCRAGVRVHGDYVRAYYACDRRSRRTEPQKMASANGFAGMTRPRRAPTFSVSFASGYCARMPVRSSSASGPSGTARIGRSPRNCPDGGAKGNIMARITAEWSKPIQWPSSCVSDFEVVRVPALWSGQCRGRRESCLAVVAKKGVRNQDLAREGRGRGRSCSCAWSIGRDGAGERKNAAGECCAGLIEADSLEPVDVAADTWSRSAIRPG